MALYHDLPVYRDTYRLVLKRRRVDKRSASTEPAGSAAGWMRRARVPGVTHGPRGAPYPPYDAGY